jgi:octaprenyl-diphosphate synthase
VSDSLSLNTLFKSLEEDLRQVETCLQEILRNKGGAIRPAGEALFRGGGKRIRPALVLWSSQILGARPPQTVYPIAAAIEMVHGASLLHDDVIDQTMLRRGQKTLNALHGNHYTVLLADFLLTQALEAICELDQVRLVRVVSNAVAEMTLGQILELQHQGDLQTRPEDYMRIIDGKTASLMAAGCMLGGVMAGADKTQVQALEKYGRHVGLAFQIIDDILDYWGDPATLGKPVGSDLSERKFTLPFLLALEEADSIQRGRLARLLEGSLGEGEAFAEILAFMEGMDSRTRSQEMAQDQARQALEALDHLPAGWVREDLALLPDVLTHRDH